jgi:RimJ/RimL family protein N-acetyltransferase
MLHGKTINLRLFKDEAECHNLLALYNNLSERTGTDHTDLKHSQTLLKPFREDGLWGKDRGTLVITDKADNILGDIGFVTVSEFELEIGYRLFQSKSRRRGIISEALPLFTAYLFDTRPITRLTLFTSDDNIGSRRVAEKSGYQLEGTKRNAYFFRGRFHDFVMYGLLREECPSLAELLCDE